jgi:hypothetical protein
MKAILQAILQNILQKFFEKNLKKSEKRACNLLYPVIYLSQRQGKSPTEKEL